ncbi:MAG: oxidoreductase [Streptosporangiales bacterium]|nr:oxidoreductase [Streptosporangiales bacterium]
MTASGTAHPLTAVAALPGVPEAVGEAREVVDRLLGHRALRRHAPAVAAETALRGAWASAALAGMEVPLDELRQAPPDAPVVQGALRVAGEVGPLLPVWRRAPGQALAKLHALAAADVVPAAECGRPASPTAAQRLQALPQVLDAPMDVSAIVVSAVVHGEVASLPAFAWGSELVAQPAGRLVLLARGLDRKGLLAPEVGHLELRDEYEAALAGYGTGTAGLARWVVHCAAAVRLGAQDGLAVCEALLRG